MLDILREAFQKNRAIGQFNVSNLEQLRAVIQAATKLKSSVIIGTSEGESGFIGKKQAVALVQVWRRETGLKIILHLDHGQSFESVQEAIEAGYDSVHFDGSRLSFEENVAMTKKAVDYARRKRIKNIEGELGYLRGRSAVQEAVEIIEEDLTDAGQAAEFVERTGVNSLAIAIGNVHGIFQSGPNPCLHLDKLKEIRDKIGEKAFLVLHGGSGIAEEDIKKAIQLGIVKININTELRIAYAEALKKSLATGETAPYKIMASVVGAVQKVAEEKIKLFCL